MFVVIAAAAGGGATVKNDGASKDRMDMIDAYLGRFGMRGLPLLSVKFGTTQLHGEASSYLKPTDDEWMRTMPEVSWSLPQGTKATVIFLGARRSIRAGATSHQASSCILTPALRALPHRPRRWRQAGERRGRWEEGPIRPQPVGRLHRRHAGCKQVSRDQALPGARQPRCQEEPVHVDHVQAGNGRRRRRSQMARRHALRHPLRHGYVPEGQSRIHGRGVQFHAGRW